MQAFYIILLAITSSVIYGVLHDQITARICIEYFTIGHPPVFHTDSPTLIGLGWGVIASWWVGLLLGVPLAYAARAGAWPKRSASSLIRPMAILMLSAGLAALLAGVIGYILARNGIAFLPHHMASRIPQEKQIAFMTDLWAHSASYAAGFAGGMILIAYVYFSRAGFVEGSMAFWRMIKPILRPRLPLRDKKTAADYLILILAWIGRVLGLALFALFMLIFIGEGGFNPFSRNVYHTVHMMCLLTTWFGYIVGWFMELAGGLMSVFGFSLFYLLHYSQSGRFPKGWAFPMMTVPGFFYLAAWAIAKMRDRDRDRDIQQ
ncbi:MAG: hypothetical protein AB1656_12050 [Candidatus Omnitrophota bacterium]